MKILIIKDDIDELIPDSVMKYLVSSIFPTSPSEWLEKIYFK